MITTEREYLEHAIQCAERQGQKQLASYYRAQLTNGLAAHWSGETARLRVGGTFGS